MRFQLSLTVVYRKYFPRSENSHKNYDFLLKKQVRFKRKIIIELILISHVIMLSYRLFYLFPRRGNI